MRAPLSVHSGALLFVPAFLAVMAAVPRPPTLEPVKPPTPENCIIAADCPPLPPGPLGEAGPKATLETLAATATATAHERDEYRRKWLACLEASEKP